MSHRQVSVDPAKVGLTAQIIAVALMGGVVVFAGVAFFIGQGRNAPFPVVSMVGAGFAAMTLGLRFVIPNLMVNAQRPTLQKMAKPERIRALTGLYMTRMIIGMALLEGAAMFNLVAYIIEGQIWSYGIVAVLLTVMALGFPSQGRFENWVEDMTRESQ